MEIEILEPGYFYHIFNRGINREHIFIEDEHYYKFLSLCKKYILPQKDVLAYCLLPYHFHMLPYPSVTSLTRMFSGLTKRQKEQGIISKILQAN